MKSTVFCHGNVYLCQIPGWNPAVSLVCLIVFPLTLTMDLAAQSQSETVPPSAAWDAVCVSQHFRHLILLGYKFEETISVEIVIKSIDVCKM